jgi:ribosome-associated toxin RatA of RatAB toxin-antitoxin module
LKPVIVSVEVPNAPEQVYDFLDELANHESFMDHFMVDWQFSGPERGVGAKVSFAVKAPGVNDRSDLEVLEADAARRIAEEAVGGPGGSRRTRGTYLLEPLPDGGTIIKFTLEFLQLPTRERIMGPLNRAYLKRVNARGMKRLAERLRELR